MLGLFIRAIRATFPPMDSDTRVQKSILWPTNTLATLVKALLNRVQDMQKTGVVWI